MCLETAYKIRPINYGQNVSVRLAFVRRLSWAVLVITSS
jgi:hypothetical protein